LSTTEFILYLIGTFIGGSAGGALIAKVLNKAKDDLEVQLKEQVFYKTLIEDIQKERAKEQAEIKELKSEISELSEKISVLIADNKTKDDIIKDQSNNLKRYENTCSKYESIIQEKDKLIAKFIEDGND